MNKLMSALIVFAVASMFSAAQAYVQPAAAEAQNVRKVTAPATVVIIKGPASYRGNPPPRFEHPSKEEIEAKRLEFEKRLKLTDEQKKLIEEQRQKDIEEIKPFMEKMQANRKEFQKVMNDKTLTQAEKDKKIAELRSEIKEMHQYADGKRKANMEHFESILTEKQKKEFEKIKAEQKKEMEQRRKNFENKQKHNCKCKCGCGCHKKNINYAKYLVM